MTYCGRQDIVSIRIGGQRSAYQGTYPMATEAGKNIPSSEDY